MPDLDCRRVLAITLVVLVIAQQPGDPSTLAFERAVRGVLGQEANIQIQALPDNPPDEESIAKAGAADGVVELFWATDGTKASIHCYVSRERRWVDREISFGAGTASPEREAAERGRLLGFAVATMFVEDAQPEPELEPPTPVAIARPRREPVRKPSPERRPQATAPGRRLEFAGIVSSGLGGTAAGLGASAGLRLSWLGPLWARLFLSGRSGNIPAAQTSTRTVLLGGGLAFAALPPTDRFELWIRADAFASYFEASHLSEDDSAARVQSRWLPGSDLVLEGGVHLAGITGLFVGGGVEAMLGKTEIYTHGRRMAVVPPFRVVGEFGFRTGF
jgi:hypothetical protein